MVVSAAFVGVMLIQLNPFHTDTKGTLDSVRINGVSILSGLCELSKKYTFYWSIISKGIKQNMNINKLNGITYKVAIFL